MDAKFSGVIASLAGAFLSLAFLRGLTPIMALTAIVSGSLASFYFTEPIARYFELTTSARDAVSFCIGLTGMSIITGIFTVLKDFVSDPIKVFKRFWPWGGEK